MKKLSILFVVSAFLISSCAIYFPARYKKSNLTGLEIGMTKEKVLDIMGDPDEMRGATRDKKGNITRVYQYDLYGNNTWLLNLGVSWIWLYLFPIGSEDSYVLYFNNDGKLVQWGRAGDWNVIKMQHDVNLKSETKIKETK